jgi:hypothetical protein
MPLVMFLSIPKTLGIKAVKVPLAVMRGEPSQAHSLRESIYALCFRSKAKPVVDLVRGQRQEKTTGYTC